MDSEAKAKSPYFLPPKEQKRWIIDTVGQFPLERRIRYYLLVRAHVGDAAIIDVGAAGMALESGPLKENMLLTLIGLAIQVDSGTHISAKA